MEKNHFNNNTVDLNTIWFASHRSIIERVAIELGSADKIEILVDKFLGTEVKFKKLKDPNAPKRAKSAFIYFCNEMRPGIREQFPELKLGGIQKELGKIWQSYDVNAREKFFDLHNTDKTRYAEEVEQYEIGKNLF